MIYAIHTVNYETCRSHQFINPESPFWIDNENIWTSNDKELVNKNINSLLFKSPGWQLQLVEIEKTIDFFGKEKLKIIKSEKEIKLFFDSKNTDSFKEFMEKLK